jgi:hypothetical protein
MAVAYGLRKPRQHLVIGGVDVFDEYGAVMTDGYDLGSPEPKTYTVDVPGGNGYVDLTDALTGDCVYGAREQTFELLFPTVDFWPTYRRFKAAFHGRAFDYQVLGIDGEGTYHGRFSVAEHYARATYGVVKLKVEAEPFRLVRNVLETVAAGGGAELRVQAGRCPVKPVFHTRRATAVSMDGRTAVLPAGNWTLDWLWIGDVPNVVFIDSAPDQYGNVTISKIGNTVMSNVAAKRVCDLSWDGKPSGQAYDVQVTYDVKEL